MPLVKAKSMRVFAHPKLAQVPSLLPHVSSVSMGSAEIRLARFAGSVGLCEQE